MADKKTKYSFKPGEKVTIKLPHIEAFEVKIWGKDIGSGVLDGMFWSFVVPKHLRDQIDEESDKQGRKDYPSLILITAKHLKENLLDSDSIEPGHLKFDPKAEYVFVKDKYIVDDLQKALLQIKREIHGKPVKKKTAISKVKDLGVSTDDLMELIDELVIEDKEIEDLVRRMSVMRKG